MDFSETFRSVPFLPRYDGSYRLLMDRSLPVASRSLASVRTLDQPIRGYGGRVEDLPGALGTANGQTFGVDETHLDQHRGLIPVDVLRSYLPFYVGYFIFSACGGFIIGYIRFRGHDRWIHHGLSLAFAGATFGALSLSALDLPDLPFVEIEATTN